MIGMFLYLSFVAWRTAVAAWERMNLGEVLYTAAGDLPIWPSRWILALSLALAAVYSIVQAARAIIALSRGSTPAEEDR
jgi:TRAP-type mannitol/chloroaromatic compound transport system permease small subunit